VDNAMRRHVVDRKESRFMHRIVATLFVAIASIASASAEPGSPRAPSRFAIIFNKGYGGDAMPKDPAEFEKLVVAVKEANFNVVLCSYDKTRAAICEKHGLQIFVDLLAPEHHVYKNEEACKKLCEKLRNDDAIYGYHLWSDNIAGTAAGRTRDVKNVQTWDETHPAYVGTYKMSKANSVQGMDLFGYYDFHWTRGGHWQHLKQAFALTKARQIPFLRYDAANPGLVGKGNPNRAGYTIATSIPFGLKGYMYHYAGGMIDKEYRLDALGKDVQKINATFASMGPELMKFSHPAAVYSTPISTDAKNDPLPKVEVPGGLQPVPKDAWFKVETGEVLIGVCKDQAKRDALILANHNPYRTQDVKIAIAGKAKVERFDRGEKAWITVPMTNGSVTIPVEDFAAELVRVERK
jgi:hypothetical protein